MLSIRAHLVELYLVVSPGIQQFAFYVQRVCSEENVREWLCELKDATLVSGSVSW